MKTRLFLTILLVATLGINFGCSSKKIAKSDVPDWYLNPPVAEDAFYGVGMASKSNPALAKQTADQRAMQNVSLQIKSKVSSLMKDFMEETNISESEPVSREYSMSVSESVSAMVLEGCKIIKREIKSNTCYALAEYNVASVRQAIVDKAKVEAKKKEELYNKIVAQQAFDELAKKVQDFNGSGN